MAAHTYWRLSLGHDVGLDGFQAIAEIQMRGAVSGPDLLTGGTATASSQLLNGPALACDDNGATWWNTNFSGIGHWWRYEFASPVDIEEITLQSVVIDPDGMPMWFSLDWSDDGSTWTTKARITQQNGWTGGEVRTFATPNGIEYVGQTTTSFTSANTPLANNLCLTRITLAEAADVIRLTSFASAPNGTVNVRGMIYAADGAEYDPDFDPGVFLPGTLMGTTNSRTGYGPHWYDLAFASPVSLTPGTYWIGVQADQTISAPGVPASGRTVRKAVTYASGAPSPYGGGGFVDTNLRPIYLTYTEGSLPTVTGTATTTLEDLGTTSGGTFIDPTTGTGSATLESLTSSASGLYYAAIRHRISLIGYDRRTVTLHATWGQP